MVSSITNDSARSEGTSVLSSPPPTSTGVTDRHRGGLTAASISTGDEEHQIASFRRKDLAQMALEYLSIPAMSAEPERVFSGARITISDRRCSLGDEAIYALECLKSWQRDGLISTHHEEIQQLENTLDALCRAEMERQHQGYNG